MEPSLELPPAMVAGLRRMPTDASIADRSGPLHFGHLPDESLVRILRFLDPVSVVRFGMSHRRGRKMYQNERIWAPLVKLLPSSGIEVDSTTLPAHVPNNNAGSTRRRGGGGRGDNGARGAAAGAAGGVAAAAAVPSPTAGMTPFQQYRHAAESSGNRSALPPAPPVTWSTQSLARVSADVAAFLLPGPAIAGTLLCAVSAVVCTLDEPVFSAATLLQRALLSGSLLVLGLFVVLTGYAMLLATGTCARTIGHSEARYPSWVRQIGRAFEWQMDTGTMSLALDPLALVPLHAAQFCMLSGRAVGKLRAAVPWLLAAQAAGIGVYCAAAATLQWPLPSMLPVLPGSWWRLRLPWTAGADDAALPVAAADATAAAAPDDSRLGLLVLLACVGLPVLMWSLVAALLPTAWTIVFTPQHRRIATVALRRSVVVERSVVTLLHRAACVAAVGLCLWWKWSPPAAAAIVPLASPVAANTTAVPATSVPLMDAVPVPTSIPPLDVDELDQMLIDAAAATYRPPVGDFPAGDAAAMAPAEPHGHAAAAALAAASTRLPAAEDAESGASATHAPSAAADLLSPPVAACSNTSTGFATWPCLYEDLKAWWHHAPLLWGVLRESSRFAWKLSCAIFGRANLATGQVLDFTWVTDESLLKLGWYSLRIPMHFVLCCAYSVTSALRGSLQNTFTLLFANKWISLAVCFVSGAIAFHANRYRPLVERLSAFFITAVIVPPVVVVLATIIYMAGSWALTLVWMLTEYALFPAAVIVAWFCQPERRIWAHTAPQFPLVPASFIHQATVLTVLVIAAKMDLAVHWLPSFRERLPGVAAFLQVLDVSYASIAAPMLLLLAEMCFRAVACSVASLHESVHCIGAVFRRAADGSQVVAAKPADAAAFRHSPEWVRRGFTLRDHSGMWTAGGASIPRDWAPVWHGLFPQARADLLFDVPRGT